MALKNIADLIGFKDTRSTPGTSQGHGSNLASGGKAAQEVNKSAAENSRLLQQVSQYVPTEVLHCLCFVRLENEQLRLTVDNAAAATRIRFCGQQIKKGLAGIEGIAIKRVSVHVKPREEFRFQQRRTDIRPNPVSESSVKLIESAANSIQKRQQNTAEISGGEETGQDPLAAALRRLAAAMAAKD